MMNDMLSQQEIDALLNGSFVDDNIDGKFELTDVEKDAIGEIGNISMGTSATTLFTLLNQKVNITTPTVDVLTFTELKKQYPLPFVAVEVAYKEGITGSNLLVLKEEDVKIITSLMMGGNGKDDLPDDLSEIHLSAISEAMNQMIGSSSTALSEMVSTKIDISPPTVFKFDLGNDEEIKSDFLKEDEQFIRVSFKMTIGDLIDSSIMQILPIEFARTLVSKMMNATQKEEVDTSKMDNNENKIEQKNEDMVYNKQETQMGYENNSGAAYQGTSANRPPSNASNINVQSAQFESFEAPSSHMTAMPENIDIIKDVQLKVTVELGRTKKSIDEILDFAPGSVVELDKLVGEPLDILVNNKKIAKGEVVVIDENYGIRVTDIIKPEKRLRSI